MSARLLSMECDFTEGEQATLRCKIEGDNAEEVADLLNRLSGEGFEVEVVDTTGDHD